MSVPMSSTLLAWMWFSALVSVLISVLVMVLGSALGLVLALALIWVDLQAPAVGAPPASEVHLSASGRGVWRPPGRHPPCLLLCPISGPVL